MKRPYFFELLVLANLAFVALVAHRSAGLLGGVARVLGGLLVVVAVQAGIGIGVRVVVALVRRDRAYLRRIRRRAWILDTLRLVVAGALMIFGYGWLKLVVPLYRAANFDAALWELDRALFFGLSPTVFFLDLFGNSGALRVIDWSYANIFYVSMLVAMAYFLSHPSRRIRIAFANGNAALWIAGAWLYFLVPSLGPAYRFPDVWFPFAGSLTITQNLQALLMRNWQNVLRAWHGEAFGPISLALGIAAFPSLHVAFQTYVFFWMRRLWRAGQVLFGVFAFTIFLGSMITGWHYLVDSLAGVVMAFVAYRLAIRPCFRLFSRA
ncbi:MAG TPA: phosphatase PAP2 family protein [Thermoanaerobaculia bacterium]|nr:phosphatase PAP2 family protein [Thermoanaerobaculia bacterium]